MEELKAVEKLVRQEIKRNYGYKIFQPDLVGEMVSNEIHEKVKDKRGIDPSFTLQMFNVNGYIAERLSDLSRMNVDKQSEQVVGVHYRKDVRREVGKHIAKVDAPVPAPAPRLPPGMLPLVMRTTREQSAPAPAPAELPTEPRTTFNPLMRK
jgi:hypothetical protein